MREQLAKYVELLFAGAQGCEDIKQEILQNTLDRYDDLIAEGKVPEAAYRLAISGIGDINEILGTGSRPGTVPSTPTAAPENEAPTKKLLRAVAVGLYILSPMPLFLLSEIGMDTIGLCGTLVIVAVATVLIMLCGKRKSSIDEDDQEPAALSPRQELRKSVTSVIWAVGLVLYFILSFTTGAWFSTWIMFPLIGAVNGLAKAIMDLKEASSHEA